MPQRYSRTAITLHWLLALLLAVQIGLGWQLEDVPSARAFDTYQFHKSLGITILVLTLLRLGARLFMARPAPAADRGWAKRLSQLVHAGLYLFMLGVPISGWALVSTSDIQVPTMLWGVVPVPHLPLPKSFNDPAEFAHEWLSWLGVALFVLHVAGAVRHHFILRDGLISRMLNVGAAPARAAMVTGIALGVVLAAVGLGRVMPIGGSAASDAVAAVPASGAVPAQAKGAEQSVAAKTGAAPVPEPEMDDADAANAATPADADAADSAGAQDSAKQAEKAAASAWQVAPGGRLNFFAKWGETPINGRFGKWSATIRFGPDDLKNSRIRVTVNLASADTNDGQRDEALKGAEFFNVGANADAVFTSTDISSRGGNRYRARGNLSLRGVSRPVTLDFTLDIKGDEARVSGGTTLNRLQFGVGQGQWNSTDQIAANVAVQFSFSARRQP